MLFRSNEIVCIRDQIDYGRNKINHYGGCEFMPSGKSIFRMVSRTWSVPDSVCNHSQGLLLPSRHRERSIEVRVSSQQTNKQTNKISRVRRNSRNQANKHTRNRQCFHSYLCMCVHMCVYVFSVCACLYMCTAYVREYFYLGL